MSIVESLALGKKAGILGNSITEMKAFYLFQKGYSLFVVGSIMGLRTGYSNKRRTLGWLKEKLSPLLANNNRNMAWKTKCLDTATRLEEPNVTGCYYPPETTKGLQKL